MGLKVNTGVGGTAGPFADASQSAFVGASATTQQVSVAGRAVGDYLERIVVSQLSTAAGVVSIFDGTTAVVTFPAAIATAVTLTAQAVDVGMIATSTKGFNVTTGANVTCLCIGRFGGVSG